MTTTSAIAAQAVETAWVCDECAGDGQLAYDLEAAMWVPRSATADWPADDCLGISVLDCLQCDGTGTVRLDPGRGDRPTRFRRVTPRGPGCSVRRSACGTTADTDRVRPR